MFKLFPAALVLALPYTALAVTPGFPDSASGAGPLNVPEVSAPSKPAPAGRPAAKEWTVMVFINGKNDLEAAGLYNVNQMEMAGSDANMNVVVELGRMNGQHGDTNLDGNWTGSRRLYITRDADQEKVTSPAVQTAATVDMGDYRRAVDFVRWAKANYPARKYMLVLWDHGSGWLDPRKDPKTSDNKGISFDDETGNYFRTKQIGQIVREAGGVDILAFDACLMQMGEVAFEVKDYTKVIVGSEETVPGMGFPYGMFLSVLQQKPAMDPEEFGTYIVESFKRFYDYFKKPAQLSAIRSSKLAGLGYKLRDFSALARDAQDPAAFKAARAGVIRYDSLGEATDPKMTLSFYGDLHQFVGLAAANSTAMNLFASGLRAKAAEIQNYIDRELVIYNRASAGRNRAGRELSESRGISVYIPPAETRLAQDKLEAIFEGGYINFQFHQATNWHDLVTLVYGLN